MNKLLVLIIFIPNLLLSQNQKITRYSTDGNLYEEYYILSKFDSTLDGEYKRFHPNGKIAATTNFKNGQKQGLFTEFYPSGLKKVAINHLNDKKHG